jgi:hypothetical protein
VTSTKMRGNKKSCFVFWMKERNNGRKWEKEGKIEGKKNEGRKREKEKKNHASFFYSAIWHDLRDLSELNENRKLRQFKNQNQTKEKYSIHLKLSYLKR